MTGQAIIKIEGHLDKKWENRFEGLEIYHEEGNTVFIGFIKDEAFLHGILYLFRDLNLKLISINPIGENQSISNGSKSAYINSHNSCNSRKKTY